MERGHVLARRLLNIFMCPFRTDEATSRREKLS